MTPPETAEVSGIAGPKVTAARYYSAKMAARRYWLPCPIGGPALTNSILPPEKTAPGPSGLPFPTPMASVTGMSLANGRWDFSVGFQEADRLPRCRKLKRSNVSVGTDTVIRSATARAFRLCSGSNSRPTASPKARRNGLHGLTRPT